MKLNEIFFIVGTDTNVGKTILSLLLMNFFYKKGFNPFYLKPFQTGCKDPYDTDSDAAFIYKYSHFLKDQDPSQSVIFCNTNPKAPLFAVRDDNKTIDINIIQKIIKNKQKTHSPIIIEGSGGLFVPVSETHLISDVIKKISATPIISARAGLGTINHTLMTIDILMKKDLRPKGVIFLESSKNPTPTDMIRENMEAIETFSDIKVFGVIDKIKDFSNLNENYYQLLEKMFS